MGRVIGFMDFPKALRGKGIVFTYRTKYLRVIVVQSACSFKSPCRRT